MPPVRRRCWSRSMASGSVFRDAVAGHRDCSTIEQCHAVVFGPPPVGQVAPSQPLPVGPAMLATKPSDHAQPRELVHVSEGRLGHAVPEVVGPAS
jgi:hypothetical protein